MYTFFTTLTYVIIDCKLFSEYDKTMLTYGCELNKLKLELSLVNVSVNITKRKIIILKPKFTYEFKFY